MVRRAGKHWSTAAIARLVASDPALVPAIAEVALASAAARPADALMVCAGIAPLDDDLTIRLLNAVLTGPATIHHLDGDDLRSTGGVVARIGDSVLASRFYAALSEQQLTTVMPSFASGAFDAWWEAWDPHQVVAHRVVQRPSDAADVVAVSASPDVAALERCVRVGSDLWLRGVRGGALQLLVAATSVRPELVPEALLAAVATDLPNRIPEVGPVEVRVGETVIAVKDRSPNPIPSDVWRVATLLALRPAARFVPPLTSTWLALDQLLRAVRREDDLEGARPPDALVLAATAVARALGAAVACLPSPYRPQKAPRPERLEQLRRGLESAIKHHNGLVDALRRDQGLVGLSEDALRSGFKRIRTLEQAFDAEWWKVRSQVPPAELLIEVLRDDQLYPPEVRQGAAHGLALIADSRGVKADHRQLLRAHLLAAVSSQLPTRDDLEPAIAERWGSGSWAGAVADEAEAYASHWDRARLEARLGMLAGPGSPPVSVIADNVTALVDDASAFGENEFSERVVRIAPDATLAELAHAIVDGLAWVKLVLDPGWAVPAPETVREAMLVVGNDFAGLIGFLSQYPLRLMNLRRHLYALGVYKATGARLEYWTRYTPPRWTPQCEPGAAGPVQSRYVRIDDRSVPNAIGVYYGLFNHVALVVPVLYHEFLHYGGPTGDPAAGIATECEVFLREMLYQRHLVATMARRTGAAPGAVELGLLDAARACGAPMLAYQLLLDLEDPANWADLNQSILDSYGCPKWGDEARQHVEGEVAKWRLETMMANATSEARLNWHPEIMWPDLDSPDGWKIGVELRRILESRCSVDHSLAAADRDRILAGEPMRTWSAEWDAYRRDLVRSARTVLRAAAPREAVARFEA